MSGFRVHLRVGVGYGIAAAITVHLAALETGVAMLDATGLGVAVFVLGIGMAILPDVDAAASISRRLFGKAGLATATAVALGVLALNPSLLDPLVGLLLFFVPDLPIARAIGGALVVGGILVGATLFGSLFDKLTKHRGFWHHPFFGVVLGLAAAVAMLQYGLVDRLIAGVFGLVITGGFFAHLVTDWLS